MPFSPEIHQRIAAAIAAKNLLAPGTFPKCSVCTNQYWTLGDGFVTFYLSYGLYSPFQPGVGANSLPSIAMICNNCGNTVFMNLISLGLADLVGFVGA